MDPLHLESQETQQLQEMDPPREQLRYLHSPSSWSFKEIIF